MYSALETAVKIGRNNMSLGTIRVKNLDKVRGSTIPVKEGYCIEISRYTTKKDRLYTFTGRYQYFINILENLGYILPMSNIWEDVERWYLQNII